MEKPLVKNRSHICNNNSCWPTYEQELLLRAALLSGEEAVVAWKEWTRAVEFVNIDVGSQRLIPLLFRNLTALSVQSPLLTRYKGVYRQAWFRNQLLFNSLEPVLSGLRAAGIEALLFKGAGLVAMCGFSFALRPMDDIDFLVPRDAVPEAVRIIEELGWKLKNEAAENFGPLAHAATYLNSRGGALDLHWRSLAMDFTGRHESGYWDRSFKVEIGRFQVMVMGAADQLIHTFAHGMRWNPIPPIRWVSDAFIILKECESRIQWEYFIEQSRSLGLTLPMYYGLRYLNAEFNAPVPDDILRSLQNTPVSLPVKLNYQISVRKPYPVFGKPAAVFLQYWINFRREYRFPSFLRYLQRRWSVDHLWQVPVEIVLRIWCRIKIDLLKHDPGMAPPPGESLMSRKK